MNQPLTPLDLAIERYLLHWRALGRGYFTEEQTLRSVSRFLNEHGFSDLTQPGFETCCQAHTLLPARHYAANPSTNCVQAVSLSAAHRARLFRSGSKSG
jgi:hypothetical protein